jgi:hypothetical protein
MFEFYVVLKTELLFVSVVSPARVLKVFLELRSGDTVARDILRGLSYKECKYYKLKIPVLLPARVDHAEVLQKCLDESNWKEVSPHSSLSILASTLTDDRVYMVIKPPGGESPT